ncbi:LysR family transcriptional regulator [Herbaspirillum autotrophicum]|uniref:LysR family transcriptional regulator n=1 Tax=Herbaspirillum autotrophicum TaxID=180195 RepID=UPI00067BC855|nr:LysR family transcriptional regulator [Herbaspirillum autotrophicum]
MRLDKLDLNLLVALDTLLDTVSVSEASRRMHLTQSAMSNALGRLRDHFGDPLLVPMGRKMVMTERGRLLKAPIREILLQIQQVTARAEIFDAASSNRCFKVAASDYFVLTCAPIILEYCARHAPSIVLDFQLLTPGLSDALDRGEVDLLVLPEIYRFEKHPSTILLQDDWVCIVSNRGPDQISKEDFFSCTHVVKAPIHDIYVSMDEWAIRRINMQRKVAGAVPQYGHLPQAVARTPHLALIQRKLAGLYTSWLPIKILDSPIDIPPLVEIMQWNRINENDPGLAWLRSVLFDLFHEENGINEIVEQLPEVLI